MRVALTALLLAASSSAFAAEKYLPFPTLAACQDRSRQQCTAQGCDGVNTRYWWRCDELKDGTAVLVIEPDRAAAGFDEIYKGVGLMTGEKAAIKGTK